MWLKLGLLITAIALGLYIASAPGDRTTEQELSGLQGDANRGELIFHIGGCGTCHKAADAETAGSPPLLGGGMHFETAFGTFIAPNISTDKATGIGGWTTAEFATALKKGVSPEGQHYYPAFPYTSYARMELQDVVDLKAYMDTLPAVARQNQPHELGFPYSLRRGLGLWKRRYLSDEPAIIFTDTSPELLRGQYLVEALGHCSECHTPRDFAGGLNNNRWLAGGPNPDGDGSIPNITPHETGIEEWDVKDIAGYLSSGFTPDYDVVGGSMADVVDNTAKLSDEDREAIAVYLKAIPEVAKIKKD